MFHLDVQIEICILVRKTELKRTPKTEQITARVMNNTVFYFWKKQILYLNYGNSKVVATVGVAVTSTQCWPLSANSTSSNHH